MGQIARWASPSCTLVVAASVALGPRTARAAESEYDYSVLMTSGDSAPGGDKFGTVFEVWSLNDHDQVAFDTDLQQSKAIGAYRYDRSRIVEIAKTGTKTPDGGTFSFPATMSMNGAGDVAFTAVLRKEPGTQPIGVGNGVYVYSARTGTLRAVVTPSVTATPEGSLFRGVFYHDDITDRGGVSFSGIFPTSHGIPGNPSGLGTGVFRADPNGSIARVAGPGDTAPGGVFDFVYNATINEGGDAAFGGHIRGEECIDDPTVPTVIHCTTGVYTRRAGGPIIRVAHPGDPAPNGGAYRQAHSANIDRWGNVAFIGDLTPPPAHGTDNGVFLYIAALKTAIPVVRPGDPLPGGGRLGQGLHFDYGSQHINEMGQITIPAVLDTVTNGRPDEGIYTWSLGGLHLVARTGTVIPGVGKIAALQRDGMFANVAQNNLGHLAFRAQLEDGRFVVLLASPHANTTP